MLADDVASKMLILKDSNDHFSPPNPWLARLLLLLFWIGWLRNRARQTRATARNESLRETLMKKHDQASSADDDDVLIQVLAQQQIDYLQSLLVVVAAVV